MLMWALLLSRWASLELHLGIVGRGRRTSRGRGIFSPQPKGFKVRLVALEPRRHAEHRARESGRVPGASVWLPLRKNDIRSLTASRHLAPVSRT